MGLAAVQCDDARSILTGPSIHFRREDTVTNPYESVAGPNSTQPNGTLTHKAGKLDLLAYRFISVGYFLTLIGIILAILILLPLLLLGTMMSGFGSAGPIEVILVLGQIFFTALYMGITWAVLRTLRIVAKKHCEES